jgi:hypothetical protein
MLAKTRHGGLNFSSTASEAGNKTEEDAYLTLFSLLSFLWLSIQLLQKIKLKTSKPELVVDGA